MSCLRSVDQTALIRKFLFPFITMVVLGGVLFAAAGEAANPIETKRAQAQAILAEVARLDTEVGHAAERWNGANYKLRQISDRLTQAQADLERARTGVKTTQVRVAMRLIQLYENDTRSSPIEVILGARDLSSMIDELDTAGRIAEQDAQMAREFTDYRTDVAAQKRRLAQSRLAQAAVVRQRAAEKASIEAKLGERKRLLASVQDEVRRLEDAERRRQAELRERAAAELARQRELAAQATVPSAAVPAPISGAAAATGGIPTGSVAAPPPGNASTGVQAVAIAMRYLGIPYVWGGASPSGFDCSGLTMYVYAQLGIALPHYAAAQYGMGVVVGRDQLQPGDLVFFSGLGHMGMYIGGGNFIHAPHTGDVVKISSLSDSYYTANWVGARRVV
jgi:cell wall-associated NlpC family hydrolase